MSDILSPLEQCIRDITILDAGLPLLGHRLSKRPISGNYRGLCPMHVEKTPSFYIVPKENSFVCYGCGNRGGPLLLAYKIAVGGDVAEYARDWMMTGVRQRGTGEPGLLNYVASLARIDPLDPRLQDAIERCMDAEWSERHVRDVRVPTGPLLPFEEIA